MSYVVRRVARDFRWPIGQPWPGLDCPFPECPQCNGTGLEPWRVALQAMLPVMLDRVRDHGGNRFVSSLAGRRIDNAVGHMDAFVAAGRLCQLALKDDRAGICRACDGSGHHEDRAWEPQAPPVGEAWQLWDGAIPLSEPFTSPELFAAWAEEAIGEAEYHHWLGLALSGEAAPAWLRLGSELVSGVEIIGNMQWELRAAVGDDGHESTT